MVFLTNHDNIMCYICSGIVIPQNQLSQLLTPISYPLLSISIGIDDMYH